MNIACIGWGSLIWDPRSLPISGLWNDDGPMLPIEFARESADGRITLVLTDVSKITTSLWTTLSVNDVKEAKLKLAEREGVSEKNIRYSIGFWDSESKKSHGTSSSEIEEWANQKGLDGVVWTNLKYGFKKSRDVMPEYSDILNHLKSLPDEKRLVAEKYIRKTPVQVDTEFRVKLQDDLRWFPSE